MSEINGYETLEELAKQTRSQLIVCLGTFAFLFITAFSINDATLILDSLSIELPILSVKVTPSFLFWSTPVVFYALYTILQIHFLKYAQNANEFKNEEHSKIHYPFLLYEALFDQDKGIVGFIENFLAKACLLRPLIPILLIILLPVAKMRDDHIKAWYALLEMAS